MDHPRKAFDSLYHCAKFGWNPCSSFDNMRLASSSSSSISSQWPLSAYFQLSKNFKFGLKKPINALKLEVLDFYPLNRAQCEKNPKEAHPCASPRRLSHHM